MCLCASLYAGEACDERVRSSECESVNFKNATTTYTDAKVESVDLDGQQNLVVSVCVYVCVCVCLCVCLCASLYAGEGCGERLRDSECESVNFKNATTAYTVAKV